MISVKFSWLRMPRILCKALAKVLIGNSDSNAASSTAGSETTATALSCITYYLLRSPDVRQKLQAEIRGAFKSYDEINVLTASNLKYLHAVALEGMRIYAPLPFGLPRVVPDGGATVDGHFLPAGVELFLISLQQWWLIVSRQSYQPIPWRQAFRLRTSNHHLSFGPGVGLGQTKQTFSKRLNRFRLDREVVRDEGQSASRAAQEIRADSPIAWLGLS